MSNADPSLPQSENANAPIASSSQISISGSKIVKMRASWSDEGKQETGFVRPNIDGAIAFKEYAVCFPSEQTGTTFESFDQGDGSFKLKEVDSGQWLTSTLAPGLWLKFSSEGNATSWRIENGRLLSLYDNGNPVYRCIKEPTIISHNIGYLCSGNDLDSNYALMQVELIA